MLKHIRDIRSPIAVAQQKQAARTKEKEKLASTAVSLSKSSAGATSKAGKFPDVMSPTVSADGNVKERESVGPAESGSGSAGGGANTNGHAAHGGAQPLASVSYAIAIYPYTAEQEDEFDVAVWVYPFLLHSWDFTQIRFVGTTHSSFSPVHEGGGSCSAIQAAQAIWTRIRPGKDGFLPDACWKRLYPSRKLLQTRFLVDLALSRRLIRPSCPAALLALATPVLH